MEIEIEIVVAALENGGIGANGKLPWQIPEDMKYFKDLTTEGDGKNAVIMGRKTWDSVPDRFRPLPGRLNLVLSHEGPPVSSSTYARGDWDHVLRYAQKANRVFCIGGGEIYKQILRLPGCRTIRMTRVVPSELIGARSIECDTFFPEIAKRWNMVHATSFSRSRNPDWHYRFETWKR